MLVFKPNGQPAWQIESDGGSAAGPLQQGFGDGSAGTPITNPSSTGSQPIPEFEDIVSHSASSDPSTSTSSTTQTVTSSGSGLVFNNCFGSGATQAFINEVDAAENYLQSLFGNACTVNCSFDVQSLNPSSSGENIFSPITVSYSAFVNALKSHASTPTAVAAANALAKLSDPTGGNGVEVPVGEAQILGLANPDGVTDDSVILNSVYWTPGALQNNPGDAEAVIEHELSEGIMGRIGSLGIADPAWAPMDFFRYTASGQRDFTGGKDGQPTYFSADGSSVDTGLQFHNSVNSKGQFDGFDLADWDGVGADSNDHDPFGPGGPGSGDPGTLSATDIQIMEALGWSPPSSPPPPTSPIFVAATVNIGSHPPGYSPTLVGDFNHDGTSDMLWYNSTTRDVDLWIMSNGGWGGSVDVGPHPAGYQPVASGDFNHDGTNDVLWYNPTTHDVDLWEMSNGHWAGSVDIGTHPAGYTIVGAGDFNHDGTSDVLWYNATTHDVDLWEISNGHWAASVDIGTHPAGYTIAGIGDLNGDGTSDVVWYNSTTNDVDLWEISNGHWAASVDIGSHPAGYTIAGVGDVDGDGTSDIVWYNSSTGDVDVWDISNGHWAASADLGSQAASWTIAGIGDFNGDGKADIFWYQPATNATQTWLLGASGAVTVASGSAEPALAQLSAGSDNSISGFSANDLWQSGSAPAYSLANFDYIDGGTNSGPGGGNTWLPRQQARSDWFSANSSAALPQLDGPNPYSLGVAGSLSAPAPVDNSGMFEQTGSPMIALNMPHHT